MTENEIYTAILSGKADDGLDRIVHAIGERRKTLAARLFDSLQEGDRVRVNTKHIKPRYLDGALATVKEKRVTKVTIVFDEDIHDPYGKWAGKGCILSAEHLVMVDDEDHLIVEELPA